MFYLKTVYYKAYLIFECKVIQIPYTDKLFKFFKKLLKVKQLVFVKSKMGS